MFFSLIFPTERMPRLHLTKINFNNSQYSRLILLIIIFSHYFQKRQSQGHFQSLELWKLGNSPLFAKSKREFWFPKRNEVSPHFPQRNSLLSLQAIACKFPGQDSKAKETWTIKYMMHRFSVTVDLSKACNQWTSKIQVSSHSQIIAILAEPPFFAFNEQQY